MSGAASMAEARRILSGGYFADGVDAIVRYGDRRLRIYAANGRLVHGDMVKQLAQAIRDIDAYGDCSCEVSA